jgi:hypothetical protein
MDALFALFGGGTKRRQQTDIEKAKALHAEYKARKAEPRANGRRGKHNGTERTGIRESRL